MSQREQTNYYEILEIAPDAMATEIHKAYQRARQTYSADNPALYSMFSPEEARELLRLIDEAYNVLGNQATRKTYDETLSMPKGARGTSLAPVASIVQDSAPAPMASVPSMAVDAGITQAPVAAATAPSPSSTPASSSSSTPPPSHIRNEGFSPDFGAGDEFAAKRRSLAQATAPVGQGRTQLSTYKLDDAFESEIAGASEFDGGFLQRVRLYKNISIDKLSEATRVSRAYLMAVETNDYKSLPAAVFVRGFVVQVSRQLGLDEPKVAASYMKLFKAGGGK